MRARAQADMLEELQRRLVQRRFASGVAEEAEARAGARLHGERDVLQDREAAAGSR